jgi:hypothetical protein
MASILPAGAFPQKRCQPDLQQTRVVHLIHDGRITPHVPTEGVCVVEETLVYDVGLPPPPAVN